MRKSFNSRRLGTALEGIARAYLTGRGVRILEQGFRNGRSGEIDLVGCDDGVLVFFEVKYRSSVHCGAPEEALTVSKQRAICRTARYYLCSRHIPEDHPVRFDVIALSPDRQDTHQEGAGTKKRIHVRWIRNAFFYHA